jgi:hypothetical protein
MMTDLERLKFLLMPGIAAVEHRFTEMFGDIVPDYDVVENDGGLDIVVNGQSFPLVFASEIKNKTFIEYFDGRVKLAFCSIKP